MPVAHRALVKGKIKANDARRKVYFERTTILHLLRASPTLNEYEVLAEVDKGWYLEYDNYRERYNFSMAYMRPEWVDALAVATHMGVDTDVYAIRNGDTIPPKGSSPDWKLFADLRPRVQNVYRSMFH